MKARKHQETGIELRSANPSIVYYWCFLAFFDSRAHSFCMSCILWDTRVVVLIKRKFTFSWSLFSSEVRGRLKNQELIDQGRGRRREGKGPLTSTSFPWKVATTHRVPSTMLAGCPTPYLMPSLPRSKVDRISNVHRGWASHANVHGGYGKLEST